jgi:soluble lytic murein transglycosylase
MAWRALTPLLIAFAAAVATAQPAADRIVLDARDAARAPDRARLAALRDQALQAGHPLAPWVDYWALGARLKEAQQPELDAFYARWPGSYVEDRLRNDWLLELGLRRDWAHFRREHPRFRMADDREVDCYALLVRHLDGENVRDAAAAAWLAQRREDDGCMLMARTLVEAKRFGPAQVWPVVRQAAEANRTKAALAAAALLGPVVDTRLREVVEAPERWLARHPRSSVQEQHGEFVVIALLRLAAVDLEAAVPQAVEWEHRLAPSQAAYAWAGIGRQAALKLQPTAARYYERAFGFVRAEHGVDWPAETLAWGARAALRADPALRWRLLQRTIDAMSPENRADPAWTYWRARAIQARARPGEAGEADRAQAQSLLQGLAGPQSFYGLLALEDLGGRFAPPAAPTPPNESERAATRRVPGLQRALQLIALGLRSEGVREWNFTLRDLAGDRALLAAAQLACEREVWDRCINTSDRTLAEVDLAQRYPTPHRDQVLAKAREAGVDPAYVYGLIRQESRFIMDARSGVGASGLMQLMPATASWTARKVGLDYKPAMITDRDVNLRLGTAYLKLLVDDFEGAQALAAAGYNAGPSRPRRWREGPVLEAAAWVENIPFNETRDYVKKVLANAVHYAAVLGEGTTSLKSRLGATVGPRTPQAAEPNKELP